MHCVRHTLPPLVSPLCTFLVHLTQRMQCSLTWKSRRMGRGNEPSGLHGVERRLGNGEHHEGVVGVGNEGLRKHRVPWEHLVDDSSSVDPVDALHLHLRDMARQAVSCGCLALAPHLGRWRGGRAVWGRCCWCSTWEIRRREGGERREREEREKRGRR